MIILSKLKLTLNKISMKDFFSKNLLSILKIGNFPKILLKF